MSEQIDNLCSLIKTNSDEKEIKKNLVKLPSFVLSFLHYYSLLCISSGKGSIKTAEKIIKEITKVFWKVFDGTVTLTFGEVAESHVGMQKIGNMAEHGFSLEDIQKASKYFNDKGCETLIIKLNEFLPEVADTEEEQKFLDIAVDEPKFQAYVFIARNGMKCLSDDSNGKNLLTEMLFYKWDTQYFHENQKVVKNKLARHNLNFDKVGQEADFEKGKGTTVSFGEVPLLNNVRKKLIDAFGEEAKDLKCEGNKYYDSEKTGIGKHGDSERRKVIGVRLGKSMNMHWNWFYNSEPRGLDVSVILNPGDIYCMTEKAVGTDWTPPKKETRHLLPPDLRVWKKKNYTLRHSAGAAKYTVKTSTIEIRNQRKWDKDDNVTIGDIYYKPKKGIKNPNPKWTKMTD